VAEKYTHEELVELLQRSIALKERADERAYSKEDLAAAAKELDLDPALLQTAAVELEARRAARSLAPRPFDTRVELEVQPERFSLRVPPLRPSPKTLAPVGFGVFWLSFVAFWTAGASKGSFLFAAFSIPFWIVGLAMLRRGVAPLIQRTTIELGAGGGRLTTAPLGRRVELRVGELRPHLGVQTRKVQRDDDKEATIEEPALLLDHGTATFPLLVGFSDAERRWVEAELRTWLEARAT
jgi:hypothetical protein